MNETFNEINVLMLGSLIVSLDDDKKKASVGKGKDMQGLKQHVLSDRRKGIVGHTAVSPATLLTLGVCWEMEGESSYDCYVKLVKEIFGANPTLDKVTFCSDRGYWILKVLNYLLENGGDVHGTIRCQDWYTFTYDTDLKAGDPRTNINKAGPSTLYTASAKIAERSVSANAYRNGTGGVALTMSSLIHGPRWECVVRKSNRVSNKIPLVVHPDRRRSLLFRPFGSNIPVDDFALGVLGNLKIEHTTELQGHHDWIVARKFSSSSKAVANQVPIQLKIDREREERTPHWVTMEEYLSANGGIGDATVRNESDEGAAQEEDADSNGQSESNDREAFDDTVNQQEEQDQDGISQDEEMRARVEGMIKDATDTTDRNAEYRLTLINELKSGNHKDIAQELVKQMGGKVTKTYHSNRQSALLWLESEPSSRPFLFLTVPELKVCTASLFPPVIDFGALVQLKFVTVPPLNVCRPSTEKRLARPCHPSLRGQISSTY